MWELPQVVPRQLPHSPNSLPLSPVGRKIVAVLVVALALGASQSPSASAGSICDRAASVKGRDSAAGSVWKPFRTVRRLVRSLKPGQVGCLLGGTFPENVTIDRGGSESQPIVLRSAPGKPSTIRGVLYVANSANYVTISNLRLNGTNGRRAPSPQVNGDYVTFVRDRVTNGNTAICFSIGGAFQSYGRAIGTQIRGSKIHHCGRLPRTGHDHGIYVEGARGTEIFNNYIYENADWGIHLYPDAQGSVIRRNTLYRNGGGIIFAGETAGGEYSRSFASSDNLVAENVIAYSRRTYNVESWWGGPVGSGNRADANCLWRGARGNIAPRIGFSASDNIIAPPGFRDAAGGDLRLSSGSSCGGKGAS